MEKGGVGERAANVDPEEHGLMLRAPESGSAPDPKCERRHPGRLSLPPSTDRTGLSLAGSELGQAQAAAISTNVSSRCLWDGQYLLPGSGTRWQAVPFRVLAWQHSGVPSMLSPSCSRRATYSEATLM